VDFHDLAGDPLTDTTRSRSSRLKFYTEMSYGRASFYSNTLGSDFSDFPHAPASGVYRDEQLLR